MQLYLDSFGAFLMVRHGVFLVRLRNGQEHQFPTRVVDVVFLTKGVSVSTDALMLAIEADIPLILLDNIGHPVGQLWSGKWGSISTIRRQQILFADAPDGWQWLASVLCEKIQNQRLVVQHLAEWCVLEGESKRRQGRVLSTLDGLAKSFERWHLDGTWSGTAQAAKVFRAWEATASRMYFQYLATVMPERFRFENRNFRPAEDRFNAMLNYLYGILYARVEVSLMKVGIDPHLGILHVDRYNRPTMVYDFIEPFRCWAESVAVRLALSDTLPDEGFEMDITEGGWFLRQPTKGVVVDAFLGYLEEREVWRGQLQKRSIIIDMKAQVLATLLKKREG